MKIDVVGGGPCGLYFAILARRQGHHVRVWERNARDTTFGWGVVFSGQTLSALADADPLSHEALSRELLLWDEVHVVQHGQREVIRGNQFSGVARLALLRVLQDRCADLGVDVFYEHNLTSPEELDGELIVGADGVGSSVREHYKKHFRPKLVESGNRYIWLGTHRLFPALTLTFRGDFVAHSYQFNDELSTFIVETQLPDVSLEQLEQVFADDLQGHRLMSNNSRWIRFVRVSNRRWYHPRVALLGDALHTSHFSIGSGTKLAMEDAIALASCFNRTTTDPSAGLYRFAEDRRPAIDHYQEVADASQAWFLDAPSYADVPPLELAFRCMTRSKVDMDNLRQRDPDFVARWEAKQGRSPRDP